MATGKPVFIVWWRHSIILLDSMSCVLKTYLRVTQHLLAPFYSGNLNMHQERHPYGSTPCCFYVYPNIQ